MQTRIEILEDTAIMRLRGAVNVLRAKEFERVLEHWIERGARRIILDVGGLNYGGALAVSVVAAGFRARLPGPTRIEIAALPPGAIDVLVKNDVMRPTGLYASVAEAVGTEHSRSTDSTNAR